MAKSNAGTVQARVAEVAKLLINGKDRHEILQYVAGLYKVGERQTDYYIQKAKEQVEHSAKRSIEYDYSLAVRRYTLLFDLAVSANNLKIALQVNKEIALLQGLVKHGLDGNAEDDIYFYRSLTDEQLEAEIAKYKRE